MPPFARLDQASVAHRWSVVVQCQSMWASYVDKTQLAYLDPLGELIFGNKAAAVRIKAVEDINKAQLHGNTRRNETPC
jgi:hypothetical protein